MRIGLESSRFFFIAQFLCGRPIFKFSFACKLEVGLGGSRILRKIEVFFLCMWFMLCRSMQRMWAWLVFYWRD